MRLLLVAAILFGAGLGVPALGQTFMVMGNGNSSCGTWNADRQSGQSRFEEAWVLGAVTGMNAYTAILSHTTVSVSTDINGVFGWIDNFCRANPTDILATAVSAFFADSSAIVKTRD